MLTRHALQSLMDNAGAEVRVEPPVPGAGGVSIQSPIPQPKNTMSDAIATEKEKDNKLSKRIGHLASTGGFPAMIVAFAGDVLGPKGGWIAVGLIGVVAIVLAAYLLFSLSNPATEGRAPWWYKLTNGDKELNWIWGSQPAFFAHGIHVVAFFGVLCLFSAGKTYAALDAGGYIGKNIDAVAAAQKQLGISQAMLTEQKKTNEQLASIDSKATNFKKESSDDPRKELSNRGVAWENFRLTRAIASADLPTVELFLKGGMPIATADAVAAFDGSNNAVRDLVVAYKNLFNAQECQSFVSRVKQNAVLSADRSAEGLIKQLCSNAETRSYLEKELGQAKDQQARALAAYNAELAKVRSPQKCLDDETKDGGRRLMDEASQFNRTSVMTYSLRQSMLADINAKLMFGNANIRDDVKKYVSALLTTSLRSAAI